MLGFLHGGAIHVETFEQLVRAAQPSVVTRHVVREDLLANAVTAGSDTASIATAVQAEIRALIEHCRKSGEGAVTASDFPMAGLDTAGLHRLSALLDDSD
jgi:hypothetical protein